MHFKLILIGCIIAAISVAQIAAQCACGAEGEDVCSCSSTRVPRPRQLPRFQIRTNERPNACSCSSSQNRQQFRPVGDRCSCGNSAVLPAIRPPCTCQKKSSSSSVAIDESSDFGQTIPASFESNVFTTNHIQKQDYSSQIPVDPVSMSLAYKSAHRAAVMVPEEKLAYGFKKVPANVQNVKSVPNIPEEKLYTFDSAVVELKDIPCAKQKEEIEEEEEEEEEEVKKPNCGLGYLNYNQMGYYPQKHVDPTFSVAQFETEAIEPPCTKEQFQEIGSCGYKPGRILDQANNDDVEGYVYSDVNQYNYEESSS